MFLTEKSHSQIWDWSTLFWSKKTKKKQTKLTGQRRLKMRRNFSSPANNIASFLYSNVEIFFNLLKTIEKNGIKNTSDLVKTGFPQPVFFIYFYLNLWKHYRGLFLPSLFLWLCSCSPSVNQKKNTRKSQIHRQPIAAFLHLWALAVSLAEWPLQGILLHLSPSSKNSDCATVWNRSFIYLFA